MNMKT